MFIVLPARLWVRERPGREMEIFRDLVVVSFTRENALDIEKANYDRL